MTDLIQRLRKQANLGVIHRDGKTRVILEAVDALESKDKQIAELEAERGKWYCEECGCGYCLDAEEAALKGDSDE